MTISRSIYVTANGIISFFFNQFSRSVISDSLWPHGQASLAWTRQSMGSMPGFSVHHLLLELAQTHVHWVSDAIQPSCPLSTPSPLVFPSIRIFSNESALLIRWPKYWSFSFSICPSNEYSELISFRMNCFDLLAVPGTLKSLLQHYSSKASILRHSAFFYCPAVISIHSYWKNHSEEAFKNNSPPYRGCVCAC